MSSLPVPLGLPASLDAQTYWQQRRIAGMAAISEQQFWQMGLLNAEGMRNAAAFPPSPFGGRFGGSVAQVPSEDCLPRWSRMRSLMRGWWLQTRLLFVDTRNRRRPIVPALLRSRALRRVA